MTYDRYYRISLLLVAVLVLLLNIQYIFSPDLLLHIVFGQNILNTHSIVPIEQTVLSRQAFVDIY